MKILVPVDFSPSSYKALLMARQLASALEAEICVMHILEPVGGDVAFVADYNRMIEEAECKLKAFVSSRGSGTQENIVEVGFPTERIIDQLEKNQVTMVVMGMEADMSHLDRDVFGSNAYDIIKKGKCPVLTVPAESRTTDLGKIMLAVELQRKENIFMLSFLKRIVHHFKASLHLVHITKDEHIDLRETSNEAVHWLNENLKDVDHKFVTITDTHVAEALNYYAEDEDVGMMVLSPEKQNFFERLIKGSTTRKTVLHTHVPVLTFPEDY